MTETEAIEGLKIYLNEAESVLRNLEYDRDRKAGDWTTDKLDLIEGCKRQIQALTLAIQSFKQKRLSEEKILKKIKKNFMKYPTVYLQEENFKFIAKAIAEGDVYID